MTTAATETVVAMLSKVDEEKNVANQGQEVEGGKA
jgi:hypothetical protein